MSKKPTKPDQETRRIYTAEFKENAVRMLLDGHSASSICERLGISGTNRLYRWKKDFLENGNGMASDLEQRVRELEAELRRVERERDVLPLEMSIL